MQKGFLTALLASSFLLAMAGGRDALAGQYKTLDTTGLSINAEIQSISSPLSSGSRMEPDVYEWMADKSGLRSYRCAIRKNNTGRVLDIVMYGPSGLITLCAAISGGECETQAVVPEPGQKLLCVVGSRNFPVRARATYTFAIKRAG